MLAVGGPQKPTGSTGMGPKCTGACPARCEGSAPHQTGRAKRTLISLPPEERSYYRREGVHQEYDRRPPPPPGRIDRRDGYTHDRRDEDAFRDDRYRRDDEYARAEQQREERYRHATVDIGTRDVDVRIDVGHWLTHG
jgi:hypothetical protein